MVMLNSIDATFVSFTATGGRFGRIAWYNSNDCIWGYTYWDRWWPQQRPRKTSMAKAIEAIQQSSVLMSQALYPAIEQAYAACTTFGAALVKIQTELNETKGKTAP